MQGFFVFKNTWHFSDIFRKIEAFVMISILFEGIFRETEAFLKMARTLKYIFSGIEAFKSDIRFFPVM
jgi:hypothetical protein